MKISCIFCGAVVKGSLIDHGEVCPALREQEKGARRSTSQPTKVSDIFKPTPYVTSPLDEREIEPSALDEQVDKAMSRLEEETYRFLTFGSNTVRDPFAMLYGGKPEPPRTVDSIAPGPRVTLEKHADLLEREGEASVATNAHEVLRDFRLVLKNRGIVWSEHQDKTQAVFVFTYINGC